MRKWLSHSFKLLMVLACLMVGYGFHRMSPNDPVVSVVFTVGILGLILSVNRRKT